MMEDDCWDEIDDVIDQHEDELIDLYGDNIIFVKNPAEIHEPVWRIDFWPLVIIA